MSFMNNPLDNMDLPLGWVDISPDKSDPVDKDIAKRLRKYSRTPVAKDDAKVIQKMQSVDNVDQTQILKILEWLETRVADTNLRFTSMKAFRCNWAMWLSDYEKDPNGALAYIEISEGAESILNHLGGLNFPPQLKNSLGAMVQLSLNEFNKLPKTWSLDTSFVLKWFEYIARNVSGDFDPRADWFVWNPDHKMWKQYVRSNQLTKMWKEFMDNV